MTQKISSSTQKTTKTSASKKIKKKSTTLNLPEVKPLYQNPAVYISEVMPAPNKDEPEWIEITNGSSKTINLKNWILDDKAGGSKPYIIGNYLLKPGSVVTFDNKQTKLSLSNSGDEVRLFSPDHKIIDLVTYDSAPKNQTLSKFQIQDLDTKTVSFERLWTSQNSKNAVNPTLISFSGEITKAFDADTSAFQINSQNQTYEISTSNTSPNLAKISFQKNTSVKVTIDPQKANQLMGYKIISTPDAKQTSASNFFIICAVAMIIITVAIIYSRFYKKSQPNQPESPAN